MNQSLVLICVGSNDPVDPCNVHDQQFSTQLDLQKLNSCITITDDLHIADWNTSDFTLPSTIKHINGDLWFDFSDNLKTINTSSLTFINGSLAFQLLPSKFVNMPSLRHINGNLWVYSCHNLKTINAPFLTSIDGNLGFQILPSLKIVNMPSLSTTAEGIWIGSVDNIDSSLSRFNLTFNSTRQDVSLVDTNLTSVSEILSLISIRSLHVCLGF
jgi:hypothetical protein